MTTPWTGYDTIVGTHRCELLADLRSHRRRRGRRGAAASTEEARRSAVQPAPKAA